MLRIGVSKFRQAVAPASRMATRSATTMMKGPDGKEVPMDWDAVAELIDSPAGKRELGNLRAVYVDVMEKMKPKGPPVEIDWEAHKKNTGQPELVSQYEATFNSIKWPKYPGDDIARCMAKFEELEKEAEAASVESKKRIVELQAELEATQKAMDRLETITINEILAEEPELKEKVQSEIRNGEWF